MELAIDFEMLEVAFTDHSPEAVWVLDTATGDVIHIWDGDPEPEVTAEEAEKDARYLAIEPDESSHGFRDMSDFAATVTELRLREKLERALAGKGPFRRFKDALLDHAEDRQRWFAFEKERLEFRMRSWLGARGIQALSRT
jgi:hypothetical protein